MTELVKKYTGKETMEQHLQNATVKYFNLEFHTH